MEGTDRQNFLISGLATVIINKINIHYNLDLENFMKFEEKQKREMQHI